jgi:hypothetical protein
MEQHNAKAHQKVAGFRSERGHQCPTRQNPGNIQRTMTAEKRKQLYTFSLQACQIAEGHLKASNEGSAQVSIRSAMIYTQKAWASCQELADPNLNSINYEPKENHEQPKEAIQQPAGSPAGNNPA